MDSKNLVSQQIWFAVNRNGDSVMFLDEPIKDGQKWVGKFPYVNSNLKREIDGLVQQAQMNFEMEPQCLEIQFEKF